MFYHSGIDFELSEEMQRMSDFINELSKTYAAVYKLRVRPEAMMAVGLALFVVGNIFLLINKIGTKEYSNLVPLISIVTVICGVYLFVFYFGYCFPAVMGYRNKSRKSFLLINEIRSYYRNEAKALSAYTIIN